MRRFFLTLGKRCRRAAMAARASIASIRTTSAPSPSFSFSFLFSLHPSAANRPVFSPITSALNYQHMNLSPTSSSALIHPRTYPCTLIIDQHASLGASTLIHSLVFLYSSALTCIRQLTRTGTQPLPQTLATMGSTNLTSQTTNSLRLRLLAKARAWYKFFFFSNPRSLHVTPYLLSFCFRFAFCPVQRLVSACCYSLAVSDLSFVLFCSSCSASCISILLFLLSATCVFCSFLLRTEGFPPNIFMGNEVGLYTSPWYCLETPI